MGILGASGIFQFKRDDIPVKPVKKGRLRVGDMIIAANGKKIDAATNDGDKDPREDLGYAI